MAITKRRKIGNLGEDLASKYLLSKGFTILERNFSRKCGEIDIVTLKADELCFIEVKSVSREMALWPGSDVSHETNYRPEDNVNDLKLNKIKRTIRVYLMEKKLKESYNWNFALITVFLDFKRRISRVNMIKDIII